LFDDILREINITAQQHGGFYVEPPVDPNKEIGFLDLAYLYLTSIEWSEPWLMTLLSLHVVLFAVVLLSRKKTQFQSLLFFVLVVVVYLAEPLNRWCLDNWKLFTRNEYFDKNGWFISIVFSGPLIIDLVVMLVNFMIEMSDMIVKVKRAELRQKYKTPQHQKKKIN